MYIEQSNPAYPCTLTSPVDNMHSASKIVIVLPCLSACTQDNSLAKAHELSPRPGGQTGVLLLSISGNIHPAYPCTLTSPVDNMLSASKV